MKKAASLLALSALLVVACVAFGEDGKSHGRFVVLPPHNNNQQAASPVALPTWTVTFKDNGTTYTDIMVGTDPSKTNTTTTVPVFLIPVRLGYKQSNGSITYFDPNTVQSNGKSALQNVVNSPIFENQDYNQGGTDIGNTQYEDAFQRANFWTDVMTNSNYHVLLGKPTVLPLQTVIVPPADGSIGNEFGVTVGLADINYIDGLISAGLPKVKAITPATFPIIMTYNVYLTEGGCCIGGYHSANGAQSYAQFTYIGTPGAFSQDVSAMSHEAGEWYDDPLVNNFDTPCGILEVGDPIEGEHNPPFGGYPYTFNGFTYHLQDLVDLKYFGQSPATSNNNDWSFQGQNTINGQNFGVCSFGS